MRCSKTFTKCSLICKNRSSFLNKTKANQMACKVKLRAITQTLITTKKFIISRQNQQTILSNAKSIFNLFNSIPKDQFEYLQVGYLKIPPLGTTPTKPYRKNVNLNAEIDSIQRNVSYYGNQIDSALSVARDVYNLKSNQAQIVAAYKRSKNLSQEISQLPYNQVNTKDIVTLLYDKNAPTAVLIQLPNQPRASIQSFSSFSGDEQ